MFKVGDIIKRKKDGLEAKVIDVTNYTCVVECEDWEDTILESDWELT